MELFDVKKMDYLPDVKRKGVSITFYSTLKESVSFDEAKKESKLLGKTSWVVEHREPIADLREKHKVRVKKYNPYRHH